MSTVVTFGTVPRHSGAEAGIALDFVPLVIFIRRKKPWLDDEDTQLVSKECLQNMLSRCLLSSWRGGGGEGGGGRGRRRGEGKGREEGRRRGN